MSDTAQHAGQGPAHGQEARRQPNPRVPRASAKSHAAVSRCEAMIDHARAQIMAVGVDRFNVNEVLRQAGGSKATLAKYFGDRTGLIAAAIGAEARSAMAALGFSTVLPHSLPLREALERALGGVLRFYLTPGALSLYRAVIGAANGDPRGAAAFYHEGHAVVVATITKLLEERKGRDVRANLDTQDVADQLVHVIRAGLYERALIGIDQPPFDESEISATIATTLNLIMPGLALHADP